MWPIIRAEVTKIRTLPSVWIIAGILVALHLLIQYQVVGTYTEMISNATPDGVIEVGATRDLARPALTGYLISGTLQIGIFLPVLGAVSAGSEFRGGQLGLSVLAVPTRVRLVIGKTVATMALTLTFSLILAAITTAFMYRVVMDWDPGLIWRSDALVGQARLLPFTVAFTVIGFAITLITRRTLTAIIAVGAMITVTMTQVVAMVSPAVDAFIPLSAGRNLLLRDGAAGAPLTASAGHGAAVLIGWAVLTLAVAVVAIRCRDAE